MYYMLSLYYLDVYGKTTFEVDITLKVSHTNINLVNKKINTSVVKQFITSKLC